MFKSILYLILSLTVVFYALPRIPLIHTQFEAQLFSGIWLVFALLILGAHLDQLLGLDEEKRKRLQRLKHVRLREKEQELIKWKRKKAVM